MLREVEIECLPTDIPSHIDVDVSNLALHGVLRVSDLPHSDKIKYLDDEDATVAHVVSISEEAVRHRRAEAAVAAAGTPAEPEVAKKGKTEADAAVRPEQEARGWGEEVNLGRRSKSAGPGQAPPEISPTVHFWWWAWATRAWSICGRRITRGSWPSTASPSKKALWSQNRRCRAMTAILQDRRAPSHPGQAGDVYESERASVAALLREFEADPATGPAGDL